MVSFFKTFQKIYELNVDKFCCNKFGLAEFIAMNIKKIKLVYGSKVLDVGCGVCPIGIFLADQYNCNVIGVELNRIAYDCGILNVKHYGLESKISIINENFVTFSNTYEGEKFDIIVSNPPIDEFISPTLINKYKNYDYEILNDESFSYLTNSWHSQDGKDLLDYIFEFGYSNLKNDGCVYIVFCTIDCKSSSYVIDKGEKYGFCVSELFHGYIHPKSIGAHLVDKDKILTYFIKFVRR